MHPPVVIKFVRFNELVLLIPAQNSCDLEREHLIAHMPQCLFIPKGSKK